ncbi:imidazolonepropionase-like amidohydrolase [Pseudonocardia sediminis]|uniref:Imidazolonepropionase-like amidohydrolase n=1 Tax=Pseudonocardia sediminis TaxID=1397368 RepID=A0A4Q7UUJ7_PSEST|nr:amidohydrolase family protein [Pseudonocardia sediminis]RZT84694.1 imidazolonepropionase-like amidohydrolase [Pseudonocardia sediminis]
MGDLPVTGWRLRATVLPSGEDTELWIDGDGRFSDGPLPGADDLGSGGFVLPGLVDAHCHVGLGPDGPVTDLDECERQARTDRDAGTLLIRDCGSPVDTSALQAREDLPEIIRAARHVARPKRYIPGLAVELDDPKLLVDEVRRQAAAGDGWVKLVGDWIDRGVGDLAPLWPDDVLAEAISAAHEVGARVTAHVFGTDALHGLVGAGIDCIEHGTGLSDDLISEMAARGTALVPTLINVETFPSIADGASKYPDYAAHMRALHAGAADVVRRAAEAGIPIYAGTDAGGGIRHGRIVDEIVALRDAGHPDPLGAASWSARTWLGRPGLETGAPADLVVYRDDPRTDLESLRHPSLVLVRGRRVPVGSS